VDVGLLWTILIGFLIGTVAKLFFSGKEPSGFILTTLLGIAGSWCGSWLSGMLGFGGRVGFIGSVLGAILILVVYRALKDRS
jgi:uncharacterized membrane protein YeaQ/YmgE (transglycosylase-associated protein family)